MEVDKPPDTSFYMTLINWHDPTRKRSLMQEGGGRRELTLQSGQDFLREDQRERQARQKTCMQEMTTALSRTSNISPRPVQRITPSLRRLLLQSCSTDHVLLAPLLAHSSRQHPLLCLFLDQQQQQMQQDMPHCSIQYCQDELMQIS